MKALILSFVAGAFVACGGFDPVDSETMAIVGSDSLKPLSSVTDLPSTLEESLPAIGRLDGLCTVFHIGDGIVLSAGHCFPEGLKQEDACLAHDIEWFDGSHGLCVQILHRREDARGDLAIFKADPVPDASFEIAYDEALANTELFLLGYPHDRPLSWSAGCAIQQESNGLSQIFRHDCDSLPGNSGSPIFNSENGLVYGVHNGGDEILNYATGFEQWTVHQQNIEQIESRRRSEPLQFRRDNLSHNQKLLLGFIPSEIGRKVSFQVNLDVEDGYDFVKIRDGEGTRRQWTGQKTLTIEAVTPVIFTFESDYAGQSKVVELSQVQILE